VTVHTALGEFAFGHAGLLGNGITSVFRGPFVAVQALIPSVHLGFVDKIPKACPRDLELLRPLVEL